MMYLASCVGRGFDSHSLHPVNQMSKDVKEIYELQDDPESSIGEDRTNQVVIGDNLSAMELLLEEMKESVDMIYIDPPYNTGNQFVYNDQMTSDSWVDMMRPRLKFGRDLLKNEGFIAVSIDSKEHHHLRVLLDEVFGRNNFIEDIVVVTNPKGRQMCKFFARSHEYIVIYAKSKGKTNLDPGTAEGVDPKAFPYVDVDGTRVRYTPLRNLNKKYNPDSTPGMRFPVYVDPETQRLDVQPFEGSQELYPVFGDGKPAVWRWGRKKMMAQSSDIAIRRVDGALGPRWDVFQKDRLYPGRKKKLQSVWTSTLTGSIDDAVREVKGLYGEATFQTAKPLKMMKALVRMTSPDAVVLDFFAGTGTIGQAVLEVNSEDSTNRKFVLIQLQQQLDASVVQQKLAADFCDSIGRPRCLSELLLHRIKSTISKNNSRGLGYICRRVLKRQEE